MTDSATTPEQRMAVPHKPGDHHDYRIECAVCGQRGTLNLSVEPQRFDAEEQGQPRVIAPKRGYPGHPERRYGAARHGEPDR